MLRSDRRASSPKRIRGPVLQAKKCDAKAIGPEEGCFDAASDLPNRAQPRRAFPIGFTT
ncbi:hypothetical protein JCM15519_03140 [Fundidesulfovibrio butyratiphilus]